VPPLLPTTGEVVPPLTPANTGSTISSLAPKSGDPLSLLLPEAGIAAAVHTPLGGDVLSELLIISKPGLGNLRSAPSTTIYLFPILAIKIAD